MEETCCIVTVEVSRLSTSTQQLCKIINFIKQKRPRLIIIGSITVDYSSGIIDPMSHAFVRMCSVYRNGAINYLRPCEVWHGEREVQVEADR